MNESHNTFVSSRGILKSCDWFSLNPQSSIQHILNYPPLQPASPGQIRTFYICSSAIPFFIKHIVPNLKKPFILVGGDCDHTIPNDIFPSAKAFNEFVNNPNLVHWFSQNLVMSHPKMSGIPIGLDYHTLSQCEYFGEPTTTPAVQELQLLITKSKSAPFWERTNKCYANFQFLMTTKYGFDRRDAIQQINKELVFYEPQPVKRSLSWGNQINYAFVLSPHGNGYDCHRLWEALALGCIPIVKTSALDGLYKHLPVLIVNQWSDITKELLDNTIELFKKKHKANKFNYKKLTLKYWIDKINMYKVSPLEKQESESESESELELEVDKEPELEVNKEPELEVDKEPGLEVNKEPELEPDKEVELEVKVEPELENVKKNKKSKKQKK